MTSPAQRRLPIAKAAAKSALVLAVMAVVVYVAVKATSPDSPADADGTGSTGPTGPIISAGPATPDTETGYVRGDGLTKALRAQDFSCYDPLRKPRIQSCYFIAGPTNEPVKQYVWSVQLHLDAEGYVVGVDGRAESEGDPAAVRDGFDRIVTAAGGTVFAAVGDDFLAAVREPKIDLDGWHGYTEATKTSRSFTVYRDGAQPTLVEARPLAATMGELERAMTAFGLRCRERAGLECIKYAGGTFQTIASAAHGRVDNALVLVVSTLTGPNERERTRFLSSTAGLLTDSQEAQRWVARHLDAHSHVADFDGYHLDLRVADYGGGPEYQLFIRGFVW